MPTPFVDIRENLITVADMDSASVVIDRGPRFEARVRKYASILSKVDTVTVELQKKGAGLADCRYAIEVLRAFVANGRQDPQSVVYGVDVYCTELRYSD